MRFVLFFLLVACLCGPSFASLLFVRESVPEGWVKTGPADASAEVDFLLALKQRNLNVLEDLFWQVSTPGSQKYRQFQTPDEILSLIAPEQQDHDQVVNWLLANGVDSRSISSFGDAIRVRTTAKITEQLFQTQMFHYSHSKKDLEVIRQFGRSELPAELSGIVELVEGISNFPIEHFTVKRSKQQLGGQQDGYVPEVVQLMYNTPVSTQNSAPQTSQSVIEFQGQYFSPKDLSTYSTKVGVPITPVPSSNIIGPNDPDSAQDEATLDIQWIAGVNNAATNWFWSADLNDWLYGWSVKFFNATSVPQVASISYGWWEEGQCSIAGSECSFGVNSITYVNRVNVEFQKIGLRGVSLIASAGDSGVHGRTDGNCIHGAFRPDFPGSSPYVTTVGATMLTNQQYNLPTVPPVCVRSAYHCVSGGNEVVVSYQVSGFATGGGFSNVAPTPSYQQKQVSSYFSSGVTLPPSNYYNASGRGAPDVAAFGHNGLIYLSGLEAVGGTSMSAPIFAGVVALLNQASLATSNKPLGFLNPLLYQMSEQDPSTFTDITSGDNICTEDGCGSLCKGFYATKGWDPVSGLGSPQYPAMLKYVQNL